MSMTNDELARRAMNIGYFEAYDANTRAEDGDAFEDYALADRHTPVSGLGLAELERDVYLSAFEDVPGREMLILGYLYYWGETMRQVGKRLGLSHQRVHQLRDDGLAALKEALEVRGVTETPRTLPLWRFLDPA